MRLPNYGTLFYALIIFKFKIFIKKKPLYTIFNTIIIDKYNILQ